MTDSLGAWRLVFLVSVLLHLSEGWHDFTDVDFHCWPLTASASDPTTTPCTGLTFEWVVAPPSTIKAEADFNVTYELILTDDFYDWAVSTTGGKQNFFATQGFDNGTLAQEWCENTVCPTDSSQVSLTSCCIWHVNVHSCPLSESSYCPPWISPEGEVYTHSDVLWGTPTQGNWTSSIGGLYVEGTTQLIAHFKVADMQMVLYMDIEVEPKSECGNDICETEDLEDCSTCPADCGACPFEMEAWQLALIAIGGAAIIIGLGVFIGYNTYKQRKMLWDESWIISHDEIISAMSKKAVFGSTLSMGAGSDGASTGLGDNKMQQSAANRQLFCKVTVVKGKNVAIRDVHKSQFSLTKQVRKEVKDLRSLDHQNICKFMGACIEVPNCCLLAEYCPKGSLADVLQNPDVPLTWPFRFSFASDVARGMNFIYTSKMVHGRLNSNNCVIDDRWTVKITDFGIPTLRSEDLDSGSVNQSLIDDLDYKEKALRVYKPPEAGDKNFQPGEASDTYAFAIILIELATRNDPYGDEDTYDLPMFWKPPLPDLYEGADSPENTCPNPDKYLHLIQECWNENAHARPAFDTIKKTIQKINPNRQSPVDIMMAMMEKYSKHLESIVNERTADLQVEKQKTDRLLYSMLPRAVADNLRQGKAIGSEEFDQCTIYFSDIVGFTVISGGSTPFEVVGLLNKLYTCFDSVIEKYDVYKVETIGDAYMVVSGVPTRNGNRHAYEIAGMSVDLVDEARTFVIPHMPKTPLKIRVGLHSGSVCGGVVGLKMPRYCLFGDTVNTASRMESNGEEYKIHISNFTYVYLQKTGGFVIECRGVIPIKGKGDMKTWWIKGRSPQKEAKTKLGSNSDLPGQAEDSCKFKKLQEASGPERKVSSSNDSGYNEAHDGTQDRDKLLTPVADI